MTYTLIEKVFSSGGEVPDYSALEQEIFDYLSHHIADVSWILNNDLTFRYVSKGVLGYDAEEFTGRAVTDFVPEMERQRLNGLNMFRKEKPVSQQKIFLNRVVEFKMLHKNGDERDVEIFSVPFSNSNGDLLGSVGGFRILDDLQKNATRAREEIRRLHEVFNQLYTGIFRTSASGRIIYMNRYLLDYLGFKNYDELKQKAINITDFYTDKEQRTKIFDRLKESDDFEKSTVKIYNSHKQVRYLEVTARAEKNEKGEVEFFEGMAIDVSDSQRTLKRLERSKANLNTLLGSTHAAYVLLDNKGFIKAWNPQALKLPDVLTVNNIDAEIHFSSFVIPGEKGNIHNDLEKSLAGDKVSREISLHGCEKELYFTLSFYPVIIKDNEVDSVVVCLNDITKTKETEKHLQDTVHELQDIFENSLTGIMMTDADGMIRKINRQVSEIFGYSRDEMLNSHFEMLTGKNMAGTLRSYEKQIHDDGIVNKLEMPFRHQSGKEIILRFNARLVAKDDNARESQIIWNLQDITGEIKNIHVREVIYKVSQTLNQDEKLAVLLQETRELLSDILTVENFMIALYDEDRNEFSLPFMADTFDQFTAYSAQDTISSMVVNEKRSYFLKEKQIKELVESGRIKIKGAAAKVWVGVPMLVKGRAIGVIAVQDYQSEDAYNEDDLKVLEFVSEQISMSILRKKNEEQLKENIETKNKFFSIIAHDLKSPFNSLIGLSSILSRGTILNEADRQEIYQNLYETSREGFSLLENLLIWTRSQLGRTDHKEDKVNIYELTEQVFTLLSKNANLKQINLKNQVHKDVVVYGDTNKIQTVIRNLVSNALKYSHQNSDVIVKAKRNPAETVISVVDFGIGMDTNMTEKLFSPGHDFKRPGTKKEKGTGLGLLISREFIEQHGGKIWVESSKDSGSVFYFSVPHKQQALKKYDGVEIKNQVQNMNEGLLSGKNILVVEDVEVNYVLLMKILQKLGANVIHAWNGLEAVEYVSKQKPDAILMDINMPIMNGLEATGKIKEIYPDIPVIIQTAYTSSENRIESNKVGADDYIEKPILRSKLENCLKKFF